MSFLLMSGWTPPLKRAAAAVQQLNIVLVLSRSIFRMASGDENTAEGILRQFSTDIEAQLVSRQ